MAVMKKEYQDILKRAQERADFIQRQMRYLSRFHIKNFDHVIAQYQDEAFQEIDCLKCGNCCRQRSPVFSETDLKRLAKALGFQRDAFVRDTLERDQDGNWVLKSLPCPFLNDDNTCQAYDVRPKDCEAYPYCAERGAQRALGRLARNATICPVAYMVAERLIERYAPGTDA